jgi:hypothetical protein
MGVLVLPNSTEHIMSISTFDFDQLVPDPQVRRELGGISAMTLWRWDRHPDKAPPGWESPVKIGKRNYRRRSAVEAVKRGGSRPAAAP